jgi:hypothetical protein
MRSQKLKPENRAAKKREVLHAKSAGQAELKKPVDSEADVSLGIRNGFYRGARVR